MPKMLIAANNIIHVSKVIGLVNIAGYTFSTIFKTDKVTDLCGVGSFGIATLSLARRTGAFSNIFKGGNLRLGIGLALTTLWSFRLSSFLFQRVLHLSGDKRLEKFFPKEDEGWFDKTRANFPLRLLTFWTIQFLWGNLTLMPLTLLASVPSVPMGAVGWLFFSSATTGFIIETIADYQKNSFKNNNPTKLCTVGLFSKSRFPNYFGEILFWSSMWLACSPALSPTQIVISSLSPVTVTGLLFFVSGIPLLEKKYKNTYGKEYEKWKKDTNLLIPL